MAHELLEVMLQHGEINREQFRRVCDSFTATIGKSFEVDHSRMTRSEVKRRFDIMAKTFRELRHEGWSVTRILDNLPHVLRVKLDGGSWDPSTRHGIWMPPSP